MKRFLILIFALLCCSQPAFAAKKFTISGQSVGSQPVQPSCAAAIELVTFLKDAKCIGFDSAYAYAVKNPNSQSPFVISGTHIRAGSIENNDMAIVMVGGQCKAGEPVGTFTVPLRYINSNTGAVLQVIRTAQQVTASYAGCEVRGVSEDGLCVGTPRNGVSLLECGVVLQETGNDGGSNSAPDGSVPDYTGGGAGGGTNPGGDGSGGGDAGGGNGGGSDDGGTGGGGTGGDGGSGGGGGGGGSGGDGGSGGNGGSGGGGDSREANCGAPGQPACRIDEMGTPDGRDLFKDLLALVERAGVLRKAGLDDAVSEQGKDTGIRLFSLPTMSANCTDPSFDIVGRNFTVPICKYISMIGAGFEAFWAVAFVLSVMSMVSRAMNKPVS